MVFAKVFRYTSFGFGVQHTSCQKSKGEADRKEFGFHMVYRTVASYATFGFFHVPIQL